MAGKDILLKKLAEVLISEITQLERNSKIDERQVTLKKYY